MRIGILAVLVLLSGCATVGAPVVSAEAELRRLVASAAREVRALTETTEAGATDAGAADFGAARLALGRAQTAAAVASAMAAGGGAGFDRLAGYAALGVTLALCSEGVDRLEARLAAGEAAAGPSFAAVAAGVRLGCTVPLAVLLG